jgi:hypothetical protein
MTVLKHSFTHRQQPTNCLLNYISANNNLPLILQQKNTMKTNLIKTSILLWLVSATLLFPSCHKDPNNNNSACDGTVIASWKVDSVAYQSQTVITITQDTLSFTITAAACVSDAVDKTVSFEIFHDLAPGTYPLRWKMLHAQVPNGYNGGDYLIENGTNYFTDSTTNTGTLEITSVDTVAKKYSGTFNFKATDDTGTQTVYITEGKFINVPY